MPLFEGKVRKVIYNTGSFYILDFLNDKTGHSIPVSGNLFGIVRLKPGVPLKFQGTWVKHPKYGKQLKTRTWSPYFTDTVSFREFLVVCVKGFDYLTADAVCSHYGDLVIAALSDTNQVTQDLKSTCKFEDLQTALMGWDHMMAVRAFSDVMKQGGITASDVEAAIVKFGTNAPQLIRANPFRLMEVPRFDYRKADRLGQALKLPADSIHRIEGAILWALNAEAAEGHLYLRRGAIPSKARDVETAAGPLPSGDFTQALKSLEERGAVISEPDVGVYLPEYFDYERQSASILADMASSSGLDLELEPFLEEFQRSSQLDLSGDQKKAVACLVQNGVLVLTGLPGTGKTTSIRALVKMFQIAKKSLNLMAPTGIAAKRLSHVTGHPASTIHKALKYDGVSWGHHSDNRFITDAVIVDEVSMVDMELCFRLLSSLRPDTMLVLVGDDAQLPSVGPGNVLRELVSCEALPRVRLTEIFRQASQGDIVLNSHAINRGDMPELGAPNSTSEFRYINLSSEARIRDYIVKMAVKLKSRDANFQVLSPKYGGVIGVDALNVALREALNPPGSPEWRGKIQHFRVGDRIMVVKNNYRKGIYNGDVGKLLHIGGGRLAVNIYGVGGTASNVIFEEGEVEDYLRLAYAITVHKSQGNEFDTIIMPVVESQGRMLQRNLLYTSVTRAKKRVWLLGQRSAISRSIHNNQVRSRNTILGRRIAGVLKEGDGQ